MNISKIKIAWKYLWGGMGDVVDYLLDVLNNALAAIDPAKKEKTVAALNVARRVLATLNALQWLCPTKWQIAYGETVEAVEAVIDALLDLQLTYEELEKIRKEFAEAVAAWKGPDDETCVECAI